MVNKVHVSVVGSTYGSSRAERGRKKGRCRDEKEGSRSAGTQH